MKTDQRNCWLTSGMGQDVIFVHQNQWLILQPAITHLTSVVLQRCTCFSGRKHCKMRLVGSCVLIPWACTKAQIHIFDLRMEPQSIFEPYNEGIQISLLTLLMAQNEHSLISFTTGWLLCSGLFMNICYLNFAVLVVRANKQNLNSLHSFFEFGIPT